VHLIGFYYKNISRCPLNVKFSDNVHPADTLQNIINIVRLHYYMLLYFFEELIIYVYNDFTLNLLVIICFPLSQHFVTANLQTVFHTQSVHIFITTSTYKISYYQA